MAKEQVYVTEKDLKKALKTQHAEFKMLLKDIKDSLTKKLSGKTKSKKSTKNEMA